MDSDTEVILAVCVSKMAERVEDLEAEVQRVKATTGVRADVMSDQARYWSEDKVKT